MVRAKGRRRSAAQWQDLIAELDGGDEKVATFCRRNGVQAAFRNKPAPGDSLGCRGA